MSNKDKVMDYSVREAALHYLLRDLIISSMRVSKDQRAILQKVDFGDDKAVIALINDDGDAQCWMLGKCKGDELKISQNLFKAHKDQFMLFMRSKMQLSEHEAKKEVARRLSRLDAIEDKMMDETGFGFKMGRRYHLAICRLNELKGSINASLANSKSSFSSHQKSKYYSGLLATDRYGVWL